jgi:splicing factor 3A subunit 2
MNREWRVETPPDKNYQYLLVACDPYETIAFKIPNEQIDREQEKFVTNWDVDAKVLRKIF